jgi:hypothetical protein
MAEYRSRNGNRGSFRRGDGRPRRPAGSLNRTTKEIRELAQRLLTDRGYQKALKERLVAGTAGKIEELLYFYAWGKPPERSVSVEDDPAEPPAEVIVIKSAPNEHHG